MNHHTLFSQNDLHGDDLACFHTRFEQVVQETPTAPAVLFEETVWTYERLNREANRIAHRLLREVQREGGNEESEQTNFLGVYIRRSPYLIATVLACMKARRPFLLLDPDYSPERLAFMRQDARIETILTQEALLGYLPEQEGVLFLCLETTTTSLLESERNPQVASTPSDVLCAIYTSGTEGQIKAAYVEHKVLDLLHKEQVRLYGVLRSDRVLQFAAQGYDAFLWELTMALHSGATLCLGKKSELEAGPVLYRYLTRRQISIASLTPTVLSSLPDEALPDLRVVIAIGEFCPLSLVKRLAPGRHFHNAYGLMEAGICQTSGECFALDECDPSIGLPLAHAEIHILDQDHHPLPLGVPGEIAVGGSAISPRGYYNRPDLTRQTFIPSPFDDARILCLTGDQGYIRRDGTLMLLGRMKRNDVFKIAGGIRVERRELELAILQHPLLHGGECHVVQQMYVPGDSRLLAFLVLPHNQGTTLLASELRAFLLSKTTVRVAPDAVVVLPSLPLGPNGKLDERVLENWVLVEEEEDEAYVQPRTETEQILTERFRRLLRVRRISTTTKYTRLRNASLSIARFAAQVHEAFGVTLDALTITRNPTIQQLAVAIDRVKQQVHQEQHSTAHPESLLA